MNLDDLMKLAGTDPAKVAAMPDAELIRYLSPIFPDTRPTEQRKQVVAQQTKLTELKKSLDNMAKFQAMLGKK